MEKFGIGQAVRRLEDARLLTGTLMDDLLPRASDLPSFQIAFYEELPTKKNPLGVKGAGEAGAVVDALQEWGVRHLDMPLTPDRVWKAIREARPVLHRSSGASASGTPAVR